MLPPNRHQFVQLAVYSEPVFGLLASEAIPNVMLGRLANELKIILNPTESRIIVADGPTEGCKGIASDVPAGSERLLAA